MTNRDDEPTRAAFRALREQDEGATPSFDDVRHRASVRRHSRAAFIIAAAAAIIVAVGTWATTSATHRVDVPREVVALSRWRAPTDEFLPLLILNQGTAVLGASVLDFPPPTAGESQ